MESRKKNNVVYPKGLPIWHTTIKETGHKVFMGKKGAEQMMKEGHFVLRKCKAGEL